MKRQRKMKRGIAAAAAILLFVGVLTGCSSQQKKELPVRVLILPKFEVAEMAGDFPGEAQFFYEKYLAGGDAYAIDGCPGTIELYYKDGVALCAIGQGKVAASVNTSAVLSDERFDFSDAYVLSVGCAGTAEGYGILGDVFVISAAVDFDLGHHADPREMQDGTGTTWFHDEGFDDIAFLEMDRALTDRVYERIGGVRLETTERTARFLNREYPGEAWADRLPQVLRGTSVTSDNYWKGVFDHRNALLITETYGCRDPFAASEMEDIAVAQAVKRFGMLDRLIVLRVAVNMDGFPTGVTPEMLWGSAGDHVASDNSMESVDIFETAMRNCFAAGRVLIDGLLKGTM